MVKMLNSLRQTMKDAGIERFPYCTGTYKNWEKLRNSRRLHGAARDVMLQKGDIRAWIKRVSIHGS